NLSEAINPELFEGLMLELPGQVTTFAEQIQQWINTDDPKALAHAQRIAHTVKGSANVVGISGLANFTHYCEDLLELLARHPQPLNGMLGRLLIDATDTLSSLLDNLLDGNAAGEMELTVTQQLLDTYHRLNAGEALPEQPEVTSSQAPAEQPPSSIGEATADYSLTQNPADDTLPAAAATAEQQTAQIRVREDTAQE